MFDGPEELLEECMGPPIEEWMVPRDRGGARAGERVSAEYVQKRAAICDVPLTNAPYKKLAELCAAKEVGDNMCFLADFFMNKDKLKGEMMDQVPPFGWEVSGGVRSGCASVCKRERVRQREGESARARVRTCVCAVNAGGYCVTVFWTLSLSLTYIHTVLPPFLSHTLVCVCHAVHRSTTDFGRKSSVSPVSGRCSMAW